VSSLSGLAKYILNFFVMVINALDLRQTIGYRFKGKIKDKMFWKNEKKRHLGSVLRVRFKAKHRIKG